MTNDFWKRVDALPIGARSILYAIAVWAVFVLMFAVLVGCGHPPASDKDPCQYFWQCESPRR